MTCAGSTTPKDAVFACSYACGHTVAACVPPPSPQHRRRQGVYQLSAPFVFSLLWLLLLSLLRSHLYPSGSTGLPLSAFLFWSPHHHILPFSLSLLRFAPVFSSNTVCERERDRQTVSNTSNTTTIRKRNMSEGKFAVENVRRTAESYSQAITQASQAFQQLPHKLVAQSATPPSATDADAAAPLRHCRDATAAFIGAFATFRESVRYAKEGNTGICCEYYPAIADDLNACLVASQTVVSGQSHEQDVRAVGTCAERCVGLLATAKTNLDEEVKDLKRKGLYRE